MLYQLVMKPYLNSYLLSVKNSSNVNLLPYSHSHPSWNQTRRSIRDKHSLNLLDQLKCTLLMYWGSEFPLNKSNKTPIFLHILPWIPSNRIRIWLATNIDTSPSNLIWVNFQIVQKSAINLKNVSINKEAHMWFDSHEPLFSPDGMFCQGSFFSE